MKTFNFKAGWNCRNDSEVEEKSTPEEYEMQNIEPESRENGLPLTKLEKDMLNDAAPIAHIPENNSPVDLPTAVNLSVEVQEDNRLIDSRDTDGLLNAVDERKSGNDRLLDRFVPNVSFSSCRQATKKVRFVNECIRSQKPNYKHFKNENEIQLHKIPNSSSKAKLPDDSAFERTMTPDYLGYTPGDEVSNFPANDRTDLQPGIPATEIDDPENRAAVRIPVRSLRNEIRNSPVNREPNGAKKGLATNPPEAPDQSREFGRNLGIVFIVTTYIFLVILLGSSLHTWMGCLNERKSHCVQETKYAIFVIAMLSVCLLLFYPVVAFCFVFY